MIPCCIRLYRVKNKSYKPEITKIKRKPPANIYRVAFSNKAIEMINLPSVFNSTNVKSSLVTNECIL